MKITLCGKIGSGKSVIAKTLAKEFNLKHYSTGDVMRSIAKENGLTIEEFDKVTPPDIDYKVDNHTKRIGEDEDDFIFDSKMAWHFIPDAIKIFLDVSYEEGARRIKKDQRINEAKVESVQELAERNKQRWETHRQRMIGLYDADMDDQTNYDVYIDTTNLSIEEVIDKVKQAIKEKV